MKRNIYLILLSLSVIGSSCRDFLDTTPTDFLNPAIYYNTEEQLDAGLRSIYKTLSTYELYGDKMLSELALQADEGFNYNAAPMGNIRHYNVSVGDKDVKGFWTVLYSGIDKANFLLENLNKPSMSESRRTEIKGETLFLRSYFYFLLVQHFGPVPLKIESSKSVKDGYEARSSIRDVYNQIWKDLIEAEALVQPIDAIGFGGKVSKSAVQGVLARVALYMAGHPLQDQSKWADAKYWSQKIINSGFHELNPNYEQVFKITHKIFMIIKRAFSRWNFGAQMNLLMLMQGK